MPEEPKDVVIPEKEKGKPAKEISKVEPNNVRKIREGLLLSKAEMASRIVAMSFCEPRSWTRVLSS